ncbi:MAG: RNA 2'-phosphotransferase [Candidatus Competibacterales bacterium]
MDKHLIQVSKFLSFVLRHQPQAIGIELDGQGWVEVDTLLDACRRHGRTLSRDDLEAAVAQNDKQRFVLREGRIRASQGHSVAVELDLVPTQPPEVLFHGTARRHLAAIRQTGLNAMGRRHVHLSGDAATARQVGARHGAPVVLQVQALAMHRQDHRFFQADNGVWLTAAVPPAFLEELP